MGGKKYLTMTECLNLNGDSAKLTNNFFCTGMEFWAGK